MQNGYEKPFGIQQSDRQRHVYVVGKTGTGKTTLLHNLIIQDILTGRGVGVLDPHGDLAQGLLDYIPPHRRDDVVYFNPTDYDHPVSFNLLRNVPPEHRHLAASGIVSAFKSIWRDSWGPRLEYILYAAAAALLDCENTSILGIHRMLFDVAYRQWVVRQIEDPAVRSFWVNEFEQYDKRYLREVIRHAVFGNAGTLISFRVGGSDAATLAQEFDCDLSPRAFTELGNHRICVKPLIDGESYQPFTGRTVQFDLKRFGGQSTIMERSGQRYGRPRKEVEDRLRRWLDS